MNCPYFCKICTTCGKLLVAHKINFNKKKGGKYGLRSECNLCRKQYRIEHKEELNQKDREYYQRTKEERIAYQKRMRPITSEQARQRRLKDPEKTKERDKYFNIKYKEYKKEWKKQYRQNNRESYNEKIREYRNNHPEQTFNSNQKRRENLTKQGKGLNTDQWKEMMEYFDWKCAYSGENFNQKDKSKKRSVDHILSIDKKGEHEVWNLVPMCQGYNSSKGTKDMLNWYKEQEFYSEERLQKIYEWQEYAKNKWGTESVLNGAE